MASRRISLATKVALSVVALSVVQFAVATRINKHRIDETALAEAEATLLAETRGFALALERASRRSGGVEVAAERPEVTPAVDEALETLVERARMRGHHTFQALYINGQGERRTAHVPGTTIEQTDYAVLPSDEGSSRTARWLSAVAKLPSSDGRVVTFIKKDDVVQPFSFQSSAGVLFSVLSLSVGALGAVLIGWQISRPLKQLRRAVRKVAATGDLRTPIALHRNDEIGDVADAFREMTTRLGALVRAVQQSIEQLRSASASLNTSASAQAETLTRQAAALQETQTTAQEIRQTSLLAAQKAEGILATADKGDALGKDGEAALLQSVEGLSELHQQVADISKQILDLSSRALQIESITQTVKDFANQSNMLALNAAIEASRSGEHGKGFAVVAREIRMLADQSIAATRQVREILEDISGRIVQTAEVTESGARRMETGLDQIRSSGERLRELSGMVREGSSAARQIAAAVNQQSAGIGEIFAAVTEQGRMMDESLQRLSATSDAAMMVEQVAGEVSKLVAGYRT